VNWSGGRTYSHTLLLSGWIGLILFSSTGIAGRWANALYALLSLRSGLGGGVTLLLFQKAYHVFLFAVLGGLLVSAASSRLPAWSRAILWSFVIGALSEALQLAFDGRGPSFADVLLNGASGAAGGLLWLRVLAVRRKTAPRAVS
jgi:VanZ family protein